jgi:hypothetical protein
MTSCLSKVVVSVFLPFWRIVGACVTRTGRNWPLIACCTVALFSYAQNRISEYAVKAAYLFNFGKFVRFTPSEVIQDRHSFDICIVGEDPLGHALDDLTANERLDNKPVRVLRLKSAAEARGCAIAYISAAEGDRVENDLDSLRGHEVLTVSDATEFLRHGGMIQFVSVENHVRFAVNLDAVRNAQISLSSELLRVAISVSGETSLEVRP